MISCRMSAIFMLNHRYMVEIFICCLSFNFLLCMFCLFLTFTTSQRLQGLVSAQGDSSMRLLCLLHTPHTLTHPYQCFPKTFHKTLPVYMQGPFTAIAWLLEGKREYSPCPKTVWFLQCFLLPQPSGCCLVPVRLENWPTPVVLPSCFATALSDTPVPAFACRFLSPSLLS